MGDFREKLAVSDAVLDLSMDTQQELGLFPWEFFFNQENTISNKEEGTLSGSLQMSLSSVSLTMAFRCWHP